MSSGPTFHRGIWASHNITSPHAWCGVGCGAAHSHHTTHTTTPFRGCGVVVWVAQGRHVRLRRQEKVRSRPQEHFFLRDEKRRSRPSTWWSFGV
jgi:hypothetical protein